MIRLRQCSVAIGIGIAAVAVLASQVHPVEAASFSIAPAGGTYTVGSTFDVSLLLDTERETINAIQAVVGFPPDKLQLVSPATSNSIIQLWTAPPQFNNQTGRVELQGGIPKGVKLSNGLVLTLTFRVKSVGTAAVRFLDNSRILLHDGKGTDVLRDTSSAIYTLVLPPPAGPLVSSETHPDQTRWYPNANVILKWAHDEEVEGYSYILNDQPVDLPDDIVDRSLTGLSYSKVQDGLHYFHIKALRGGSWGGTTHYALKIDTMPPAAFPVEIIPGSRTVRRQPIFQFITTDAHSGLDHYEVKMIPLAPRPASADGSQPFFVETQSPYIPPVLDNGSYDVIIRAYDHAGNIQEVKHRLEIVTSMFRFISEEGLEVSQRVVIPWVWLWAIMAGVLIVLIWVAWMVRRWHHAVYVRRKERALPGPIAQRLEELKGLRAKYRGRGAAMLLAAVLTSLVLAQPVMAQVATTPPPVITTVSTHVSNEEIYYVGGTTVTPRTEVVIYLQNLRTGETTSERVISDDQQEWFYRHHTFLASGEYLLWVQGRLGEQLSPPSAQVRLVVQPTAIQLGASRISFETLYLIFTLSLLLIVLGLFGYVVFHGVHARRKHRLFLREVREAEESVRRGFAVLRRDLEAELEVIRRAKLTGGISAEERRREAQLLRDFTTVEKYIGKEIWDLERAQ